MTTKADLEEELVMTKARLNGSLHYIKKLTQDIEKLRKIIDNLKNRLLNMGLPTDDGK